MTLTTGELARICGAELVAGDPAQTIASAAGIDDAGAQQLSFIGGACAAGKLATTGAGAVIVPRALVPMTGTRASLGLLVSDDPEIAFIDCLKQLYPAAARESGVSEHARVHPSALIGADTFVAAGASVGAGARIGRGCTIQAGCSVGEQVEIGDGCMLYPNVVLYHGTILRENVTVHAGSVIGADGFGYKPRRGVHIKFPQVGTVLIERDVEIGANTCIDRAALGQTVIGAGSKLDNQVHIAHNVQVGKGVLICGQTGIGGSTVIEDYVTLASQSGIADHVRVGSRAVVLAKSGVIGDIEPGAQVMGFPATERRMALKEMAALTRVAALHRPLKLLVDLLPALQKLVKPAS